VIKQLLAAAILATVPTAMFGEKTAAGPPTPNIIMFLIDDQDFEQLSVYGGKTYTPHLDRLAKEGMTFTQAYVSSTVCTPSRYSFLTGRYAGNSYHPSYLEECPKGSQGFVAFNMGLEDDNMNVGAVLAANGYATGFVGKYHVHGSENARAHGEALPRNAKASAEAAAICKANELACREALKKRGFTWAKHVYWGNLNGPWSHHNPDWTMDAAIEFVETHKDGPFYLHYCSTLLHGPSKSGREAMDHPGSTGQGPVEPSAETLDRRKELLALMKRKGIVRDRAGETWIDSALGRLMAKLKELGIDKNTLVVFAPDHGSRNKGSVYGYNGTRIPMIMRWPAQIPAGSTCNLMVQNIDLVPTFLDVTKANVPEAYRMDGMSLRPLLSTGKSDNWRDHLYFEMGCSRAVMTKDWKYIATRYTDDRIAEIKKATPRNLPKLMSPLGRLGIGVRGSDHPGFWNEDQLYYISNDPREQRNLADSPEYNDQLSDLRLILTEKLKGSDRPFGEFIPGGNATEPGQVDDQFAVVRKIKTEGKSVILPPELGGRNTDDKKRRRQRPRKE